MARKPLGKGLGAIISSSATPVETMEQEVVADNARVQEIPLSNIIPNPDQPRSVFDENEIEGLAESIKSVGLIQPVIVRRGDENYIIVAGERRFRAVKSLGWNSVQAIVIEAGEEKNLTMALIENIQRADLDPMEEARAYRALISRFKLKQQDVARSVGKDRATIANMVRLLNLPENIQESLSAGQISTGHAKILLSLSGTAQQDLWREVVEKGLSVRALEEYLKENGGNERSGKGDAASKKKDAQIAKMEEKLISLLGTKVEIKHNGSKGKIEIHYYSLDDFDRLMDKMK